MRCLLSAVMVMLLAVATAWAEAEAENVVPPLRSASVHDPSVFKVGDKHYAFGSHLAAAKSGDLRSWESMEERVTHASDTFRSYL